MRASRFRGRSEQTTDLPVAPLEFLSDDLEGLSDILGRFLGGATDHLGTRAELLPLLLELLPLVASVRRAQVDLYLDLVASLLQLLAQVLDAPLVFSPDYLLLF